MIRLQEFTMFVFDLDGTLLDSLGDITATVNALRVECGDSPHTYDIVRAAIGNGARVLLRSLFPTQATSEPAVDELYQKFMSYYLKHSIAQPKLYPGSEELLDSLQRRSRRCALLTNKSLAVTEAILDRLGWQTRFELVRAPENSPRRKPHEEALLDLLETLGESAEQAVMIGDSSADFACARSAGVHAVGLRHGYFNPAVSADAGVALSAAEPDEWFEDIHSLRTELGFS